MKLRIILVMILILIRMQSSSAQDVALEESLDPPEFPVKTIAIVPNPPAKDNFLKGWMRLPPDLLRDQKRIWTFPLSVARGRHLKPTLAVIGVTAGLVALDGHPARYFKDTKSFKGFNKVFNGTNTARANYMIPLAMYGIGLARRDPYAQKTFILAGEAVLGSVVLTSVMKDLDRRWNPADTRPSTNFTDTWFKYRFSQHLIVGNGSLPSGHTITAFAVATVYADRYSKHRWIKWLSYGLASLDGFSRVTNQSHFTSDVFAAAALGYVVSHHVVLGKR